MSILVCKNNDEPVIFDNAADLFEWVTAKTDDLSVIKDFLDGGFITDGADARYSLMDLPL